MGYLYHGTDARFLPKIKANGLQPRSISKHKGNWSHSVPSNPKAVYLTDTYPFHFAAASGGSKHGLILEIDRDLLLPWKLCPDEDAIEQTTRKKQIKGGAPLDASMKERTMFYRGVAQFNPELADMSLKAMGTVGYYEIIPFSAVTRYVIIDWKKLDPTLSLMAMDTQVSVINFRVMADRHQALVRWFFHDPVLVEELMFAPMPEEEGPLGELLKKQREHLSKAMSNREALEIVVLKESVDEQA